MMKKKCVVIQIFFFQATPVINWSPQPFFFNYPHRQARVFWDFSRTSTSGSGELSLSFLSTAAAAAAASSHLMTPRLVAAYPLLSVSPPPMRAHYAHTPLPKFRFLLTLFSSRRFLPPPVSRSLSRVIHGSADYTRPLCLVAFSWVPAVHIGVRAIVKKGK